MGERADFGKCSKRVYDRHVWSGYPCGRKAVGSHGLCGIHSPEAEARRKQKSDAYYAEQRQQSDARAAAEKFRRHSRSFYDALKLIVDGHNDPRTVARKAIEGKAPPNA